MVDEDALLRALGSVLRHESVAPHPGELVVVRRLNRRRSSLYFVGLQDEAPVSRWVVKHPAPQVDRLGIRPPMSAAEQYQALQRLYAFLAPGGSRFAAPRPIALLPELGALAMEFAEGRSLWELAQPRALRRSQELLDGVEEAGFALRHLHTIEPVRPQQVNLQALVQSASGQCLAALDSAGLQFRERWFASEVTSGEPTAPTVLLHGDWAPENVLLGEQQVFCLDPELTHHGWPEHDVARFLLMLLDRSLFVATHPLQRSLKLRHDVTRTFLKAYYGAAPVSSLLRPLLLQEVARRWAVRHLDAVSGNSRLRRARTRLLDNYFATVMNEVGHPEWANVVANRDSLRPR